MHVGGPDQHLVQQESCCTLEMLSISNASRDTNLHEIFLQSMKDFARLSLDAIKTEAALKRNCHYT